MAVDASERAVAVQRELAAEHPGVPSYQGNLARGLYALGEARRADNRVAAALTAYQKAVTIQEKLVRGPHDQSELARSHTGVGLAHQANKNSAGAGAAYNKSLPIWLIVGCSP